MIDHDEGSWDGGPCCADYPDCAPPCFWCCGWPAQHLPFWLLRPVQLVHTWWVFRTEDDGRHR